VLASRNGVLLELVELLGQVVVPLQIFSIQGGIVLDRGLALDRWNISQVLCTHHLSLLGGFFNHLVAVLELGTVGFAHITRLGLCPGLTVHSVLD